MRKIMRLGKVIRPAFDTFRRPWPAASNAVITHSMSCFLLKWLFFAMAGKDFFSQNVLVTASMGISNDLVQTDR
jgi:hypothetical protein